MGVALADIALRGTNVLFPTEVVDGLMESCVSSSANATIETDVA